MVDQVVEKVWAWVLAAWGSFVVWLITSLTNETTWSILAGIILVFTTSMAGYFSWMRNKRDVFEKRRLKVIQKQTIEYNKKRIELLNKQEKVLDAINENNPGAVDMSQTEFNVVLSNAIDLLDPSDTFFALTDIDNFDDE